MTVSTPYSYLTGQELVPVEHNKNIYSKTTGEGIMSEANGGLDSSNLSTGFKVRSEHVWPEEVCRGRQEFVLDTVDVFSNGFSDAGGSTGTTTAGEYRPLAGTSLRVYIPYDVNVALWEWSVFMSGYRVLIESGMPHLSGRTFEMSIRARINGASLTHTKRSLPISAKLAIEEKVVGTEYRVHDRIILEQKNAMQWDMNHMALDVTAGWYTLDLTAYMEPVTDTQESEHEGILDVLMERAVGQKSEEFFHKFYQRFSLGIRNVRLLTIL
jgi:hypothetical protein